MDERSCHAVPAVLLSNSRCRSRIVGNSIEISDRLPPEQSIIDVSHQTGVVQLWKKYGGFDLIPSISPIPGFTHVSHLIDHLVQAGDPPDLDSGDPWPTTSPHQQVSVRAAYNVHGTQHAFVTSISLPRNRPHSGCYALITWATSTLARETSYSPTMLVSRKPGSRNWRVAFASGTLFDNGLWLTDTVHQPDVVVLHGASDLYWTTATRSRSPLKRSGTLSDARLGACAAFSEQSSAGTTFGSRSGSGRSEPRTELSRAGASRFIPPRCLAG